jgi:phasin
MTAKTNSKVDSTSALDGVKEAFAPVGEALNTLQMPAAARDFVKNSANAAKNRAAKVYTGSEKVTAAIETAVADSVTETAKISRGIQQAIYQDAEAFFAGIDKLASAKSLNEAVQIQSDLVRAQGQAFVSRAKAASEYLGQLAENGARAAQDNFAKVYGKAA